MPLTRPLFNALAAVATAMTLLGPSASAESRNISDYPLRIHIFRRSETTFYQHRVPDEARGDGRANLFEGGQPKGIDFAFDCSEKLQTSSGFETFPARWKKPNEELIVLQPEFGKAGSYSTCKLKVQVKDFAYFSRNGNLNTEPAADFKHWMTEHAYDPEHGQNTPTPSKPASTPAPAAPALTAPSTSEP